MSVQPLLVEDHALEVTPDAPVVGAAVLTAWFWPVFICAAEAGRAILVGAPAILFPPEDVRAAEIPAQLTSFDLFGRQPDGQLAADRVADGHARGAVDKLRGPGGLFGRILTKGDRVRQHIIALGNLVGDR